jgi:hypothetical protein
VKSEKQIYLDNIKKKMEAIMPSVLKQVAIYEKRRKEGTLKPDKQFN